MSAISVGAGLLAQQGVSFDPAAYMPPGIAEDASTAANYYGQFKQATSVLTLGKNGSIGMSDANAQIALQAMVAAMQAIPIVGQVVGAALELLFALAPQAGAGPGVCATDPPPVADKAHPTPSELAGWSHYTSWESANGPYARGAAGTFEAYALPVLAWNWELASNCFANLYVPSPVLLASLIGAWNATHHATGTRTISRSGLNPVGFASSPNFDPIAEALESAIGAAAAGVKSWSQVEAASAAAPHNVTSSFKVNTGTEYAPALFTSTPPAAPPAPVKVIKLKLRAPAAAPTSDAATYAPPAAPAPSSGTRAKIVIGGLAVAAAVAAKFLL